MKFLYFYLHGCYPCERAEKVLRDHFSHIEIEAIDKRSDTAKKYGVQYSPTLILLDNEDNVVAKLSGAHEITKIEVQGLISDFLSC